MKKTAVNFPKKIRCTLCISGLALMPAMLLQSGCACGNGNVGGEALIVGVLAGSAIVFAGPIELAGLILDSPDEVPPAQILPPGEFSVPTPKEKRLPNGHYTDNYPRMLNESEKN